MFLRKKVSLALSGAALFMLAGASAFGQEPQQPVQSQTPDTGAPQRPFGRGERRGPGHGSGMFGPGIMRELNLTDDQQKQIHTIIDQSTEGNKTQREELRQLMEKRQQGTLTADDEARAKTLHEQMRASMKETESKIAAILTPEQKAKLAELRKQREANHDMFNRRGDFPGRRDQNSPPAQKPASPPAQP